MLVFPIVSLRKDFLIAGQSLCTVTLNPEAPAVFETRAATLNTGFDVALNGPKGSTTWVV